VELPTDQTPAVHAAEEFVDFVFCKFACGHCAPPKFSGELACPLYQEARWASGVINIFRHDREAVNMNPAGGADSLANIEGQYRSEERLEGILNGFA
jgi:hypothetical protein